MNLRGQDEPSSPVEAIFSYEPIEAAAVEQDVLAWCFKYLPEHFYGERAQFHNFIAELIRDHDRVAIAAPRSHNKSTLISLGLVLYMTAYERSRFALIVSDTGDQAKDLVGAVFKELLENGPLIRDFPHLTLPEPAQYRRQKVRRKASDFITVGGVRFAARGAGGGLRGLKEGANRPDLIVCDDLENDKNVNTARQRKKLLDWFQKSLSNLFGPKGGKLVIVGTILHRDSLLAHYTGKKAPDSYQRRVYKAIKNGLPLWRDAWPLVALMAKKAEIGSRAFATEFLNTPAADGATLFKEEWIRRNTRTVKPLGVQFTRILVAVDPSGSDDGEGDACGIVVAGLGTDSLYYLLEDATMNGSPAQWGRKALDMHEKWQANAIVYEANYGGAMVKSVLKAELKEGERMPFTVSVTAKQGKSLRAEPVSVEVENDHVVFLGAFPALKDQMTEWVPGMPSPNNLDAAVYALLDLMGTNGLLAQNTKQW